MSMVALFVRWKEDNPGETSASPSCTLSAMSASAVPSRQDSPAESPGAAAPGAAEDAAEEDRVWIRRAASRRFQAGEIRQKQADLPLAGYEPQFSSSREADVTLAFELPRLRRGRDAVHEEHQPEVVWMGTLGVAAAVGMILLPVRQLGGSPADPALAAVLSVEPARPSAAGMVSAAREAVGAFFTAASVEEKAAMVRGGERMMEAMRGYYRVSPDEPAAHTLASNVEFLQTPDGVMLQLRGVMDRGIAFDVLVEGTPAGPKLDWRYLTGSGDLPWSQWLEERPAREVWLRCAAVPDDYYAGEFHDSAKWFCLRITDITRTHTVWAYAERNGPLRLPLLSLQRTASAVRLQCGLVFPEAAAHADRAPLPQVMLTGLKDFGWLDQSPEASGDGETRDDGAPKF